MNKEFKELQEQNGELRYKIKEAFYGEDDHHHLMDLINELIENEIEQESFCNI